VLDYDLLRFNRKDSHDGRVMSACTAQTRVKLNAEVIRANKADTFLSTRACVKLYKQKRVGKIMWEKTPDVS